MALAGRTRPDRDLRRRVRCALLGCLLLAGGAAAGAQSAVKQVLVLQSFDRGNLTLDHFTSAFRANLDQNARPLNLVQVVVGATGFVHASDQSIVDYVRSMYAARPPPDLIITVAGPAALFARKYRQQL